MGKMPDSCSDQTLLLDFVNEACESSFEELVRRHSGLVYGVALRVTGSRTLAEEATQIIFATVVRKARALSDDSRSLSGWLHRATVLESTKLRRREGRHQRKKAAIMDEEAPTKLDDSWKDALPCLDLALNKLPQKERQLVLWHYAEGMTFPVIAKRLGKTTAAVQKQGQRALGKLQKILKARGVSLTGTAVASMLAGEMAKGAPVALLPSLTPLALTQAPILPASISTIVMTTKTKILIPVTTLLLCGVPLAYKLNELQNLKQETSQIASQLDEHNERRIRPVANAGPRNVERVPTKATLSDLPRMAEVFHRNATSLLKDRAELSEYEERLRNSSPDKVFELLDKLPELDIPYEWKVEAYRKILFSSLPPSFENCSRILDYAVSSEFHDFSRDRDQILRSLRLWGYEEGEASVAWLDEQLENGKLAGKLLAISPMVQRRLDAMAFSALMSTDMSRALAWIAKRPEVSQGWEFNPMLGPPWLESNSDGESGAGEGSMLLPSGEVVPSSVLSFYTSDLLLSKGPDAVTEFVTKHFPDRSSQKKLVFDTLRRFESEQGFFPYSRPNDEPKYLKILSERFLEE